MEFKQEPNKLERARNQKMLQDSLISNLSMLFAVYPSIPMVEHLRGILRAKGSTDRNPKYLNAKAIDPFTWTDEKLVKATEQYLRELEQDPPQLWGTGEDELTEEQIEEFYERNK